MDLFLCQYFQGQIETQGDYDAVIRSGVDLTSILKKDFKNDENGRERKEDEGEGENEGESQNEVENRPGVEEAEEVAKSNEEDVPPCHAPSVSSEVALDSQSVEQNNAETSHQVSKNEGETMKELEASSKGKVKGSLLLNYFKSANRPCVLVFLFATFLLAQILASSADMWVSYW